MWLARRTLLKLPVHVASLCRPEVSSTCGMSLSRARNTTQEPGTIGPNTPSKVKRAQGYSGDHQAAKAWETVTPLKLSTHVPCSFVRSKGGLRYRNQAPLALNQQARSSEPKGYPGGHQAAKVWKTALGSQEIATTKQGQPEISPGPYFASSCSLLRSSIVLSKFRVHVSKTSITFGLLASRMSHRWTLLKLSTCVACRGFLSTT